MNPKKFYESDLRKLGYVRQPDGSYAKPDSANQPAHPRTLVAGVSGNRPQQADAPALGEMAQTQAGSKDGHLAGLGPKPKIQIRIENRRTSFLDPDNLYATPKFLIDQMRALHLIPDDSPEHIELTVTQTKVATETEQGTLVQIIYPDNPVEVSVSTEIGTDRTHPQQNA